MMSLGQGEPIYTYSHQNTRQFIREAGYGGRVGGEIQEFNSCLCTVILTILQNHKKSDSQEFLELSTRI